MTTNSLCVLCGGEEETRNHLFFLCGFSKYVWNHVLQRLEILYRSIDWDQDMEYAIHHFKGNSLAARMGKVGFAAAVYSI